jgi:hypothetical protein
LLKFPGKDRTIKMNKVLGVCDFVAPELCVPVGVLAVGRCLRPRTIKTTCNSFHKFSQSDVIMDSSPVLPP